MMVQVAPLLPLLLLFLMDSQGQEFQVKYQEGQTLKVNCNYNDKKDMLKWKIWCKVQVQVNRTLCDKLMIKILTLAEFRFDDRISLTDDGDTGIITITMSNLRVNDSGIYWCGIQDFTFNPIKVVRKISLEVSPATALKTTEHSQTTTETLLTTSVIPLDISSQKNHDQFIIWGSIVGSLLLYGLLYAGIYGAVKISQKSVTGDNDCRRVYDDFHEQKQKARDTTIEMQEVVSEVIPHPSVIHGNQLSLGDSIYTNTEMEHKLGSAQVPIESVEYSSIARPRDQLPK
ncbi:uncharacterized protein LOC141566444 isoform X2 [Sminthopsis crassicaudata]|uniref:uncharacterized protein LOC141566444 isoform X2 n=1 Tax=Sminthopsis crassicaudata TaxID=9301 RepID=UPI003D690DD9